MSVCFATDQNPNTFAKWAKRRGIFLHPDVAFLVPTKTMGLGVFARKPLPAGTVVVGCPFSSCISPYSDKSNTESASIIKALADSRLEDNLLHVVLRLMAEAMRPTSPWMPWLKACPRMLDHFFDCVEEDTTETLTDAANALTRPKVSISWTGFSQQLRDVMVKKRWEVAQEVIRRHPEHWPAEYATFSFFCECLAHVLSRNFHREEVKGREGPYLLPGLDIINHSFDANGKFEIRGGGRKHPMNFCVITSRNLHQGEQVFCSYGKIGVSRFAIEFQFLTDAVVKEDLLRFSLDIITEMTMALNAVKGSSALSALDLGVIQYRLERLQRLGFLCDEGLYVSRLPPPPQQPSSAGTKEIQMLCNVFYLMTVNTEKFEDLIHLINRDWKVARSEQVVALLLEVLTMREKAAQLHLAAVFPTSRAMHLATEASDTTRKNLLHTALESELEMIHLLQQHVNECW